MMKKLILTSLFGLLLFCGFSLHAHASGYSYYRTITVTSTPSVASGTNANFPMEVSSTFSSWESSSTGGRIQNLCTAATDNVQEPCDLVFATSSANCGTSNLNFETEAYTSSTGALVDWVQIPSESAGTSIVACYGNASVSTDQSHPSSTWDANYTGVYHEGGGGTSTHINLKDSTANANDLTDTFSNSTEGTGQIDGGSTVMSVATPRLPGATQGTYNIASSSMTVSTWFNYTDSGSYDALVGTRNAGTACKTLQFAISGSKLLGDFYTNGVNGNANVASNTWHYGVFTYNTSGGVSTLYLDGVQDASASGNCEMSASTNIVYVGATFNGDMNGSMDETRISDTNRSPSRILTEYNNQKSPSTFYSVGAEQSTVSGIFFPFYD